MRLLFVIPHYFRSKADDQTSSRLRGKHASIYSTAEVRAEVVRNTILTLHQTFGPSQAMIRHADRRTIAANRSLRHQVDVIVATTSDHLMDQISLAPETVRHDRVQIDPVELGFHCHQLLREAVDQYDYFCYLEDDLTIQDPMLFQKLSWFNSCVGDDKVLLPNRFELSGDAAYKKCYIDGDLSEQATKRFQDVSQMRELKSSVMGQPLRFVRPLNPHSGCFFLNAVQMKQWITQSYFGASDASFVGPLESAATLGIMKTFGIYKPAPENAAFLEIQHNDNRFIKLIVMPR